MKKAKNKYLQKLPQIKSLIGTWNINIDTLLLFFEFIKKLKSGLFVKFENHLKGKKCTVLFDYEAVKNQLGPSVSFLGLELKECSIQNDDIINTLENLKKENIDLLIIKTNKDCFSRYIEPYTNISILNMGDGKTENPFVAIRDLYTIYERYKKIEDLKIGFLGDIVSSGIFRSLLFVLMKVDCYIGVFTHPLFYSNAFNSLGVRFFLNIDDFSKIKWDFLFYLVPESNNILLKDKSIKYEYECYYKIPSQKINTHLIIHNHAGNPHANNKLLISSDTEKNEFFCNLALFLWILQA